MPGPSERNWDKEMAEVDKLLSKLPTKPDESHRPAPGAKGAAGQVVAGSAGSNWLSVWLRVGLGVVFAFAMMQWPYRHACGWPLAFYSIGIVVAVVWGTWGMWLSWRRRQGFAHTLSVATLVTGIVLAVGTVAPRVASPPTAEWFCPGP